MEQPPCQLNQMMKQVLLVMSKFLSLFWVYERRWDYFGSQKKEGFLGMLKKKLVIFLGRQIPSGAPGG